MARTSAFAQRHDPSNGRFTSGTGGAGGESGGMKQLADAVKARPAKWVLHKDGASFHGDKTGSSDNPIGTVKPVGNGWGASVRGSWKDRGVGNPHPIPFKTPDRAMDFVERIWRSGRKEAGMTRVTVFAQRHGADGRFVSGGSGSSSGGGAKVSPLKQAQKDLHEATKGTGWSSSANLPAAVRAKHVGNHGAFIYPTKDGKFEVHTTVGVSQGSRKSVHDTAQAAMAHAEKHLDRGKADLAKRVRADERNRGKERNPKGAEHLAKLMEEAKKPNLASRISVFAQRHGADGRFVSGGSGSSGGAKKAGPPKMPAKPVSVGAGGDKAARKHDIEVEKARKAERAAGWKGSDRSGRLTRKVGEHEAVLTRTTTGGKDAWYNVTITHRGQEVAGKEGLRLEAAKKYADETLKRATTKRNPRFAAETFKDKPLPESWSGVLVVEGSTTDDGRMFAANSLEWRELPLPLAWQMENADGHKGSVLVGRIDSIERDGDKLLGRGVFDLGSDNGKEVARLVRDGFLRGISVDVAVDDGQVDVVETDEGRSVTAYSAGRILGATVLPLQAFAEASIQAADTAAQVAASGTAWVSSGATTTTIAIGSGVTASTSAAVTVAPQVGSVLRPANFGRRATVTPSPRSDYREWVVASAPVHPPLEWFADPGLDGPRGVTVEENGRVYGHLATWDTCHTSFGEGAGRCVRPPRSDTAYAYFHTGELMTSEGVRIPVGRITVGANHAPLRDSANAPVSASVASEHYEHTGWVAADVVAGEDDYGIWIAGALRPGIDGPAMREFRAAPLSGDWRRIGGNLELVGALAVNVPGFPVKRVQTLVASGQPVAFIAFPESPDLACERAGALGAIGERIARSIGLDNDSLAARLAERVGV